ncbi:MAG: 50S ribosomal protein L4 [bacterium]|nr:50S ribosomal protein L4 [bacterium]
MNVKTYNQKGEEVGMVELPDSIFALKWNADLVHQVAVSQEANKRQNVAHAKGRSEVRGGGRKPWRQKGTGRSRHGSIRSPLWKGGGVTHGPLKEKVYKKKINKKMAAKALAIVLSAKMKDSELLILDGVNLLAPKTKEAKMILNNISKISGYAGLSSKSVIMGIAEHEAGVIRAFRNLPNFDTEEARNITCLDLLAHKFIILPKEALEVFKKRLAKQYV